MPGNVLLLMHTLVIVLNGEVNLWHCCTVEILIQTKQSRAKWGKVGRIPVGVIIGCRDNQNLGGIPCIWFKDDVLRVDGNEGSVDGKEDYDDCAVGAIGEGDVISPPPPFRDVAWTGIWLSEGHNDTSCR